jgi:hypothetical protein
MNRAIETILNVYDDWVDIVGVKFCRAKIGEIGVLVEREDWKAPVVEDMRVAAQDEAEDLLLVEDCWAEEV